MRGAAAATIVLLVAAAAAPSRAAEGGRSPGASFRDCDACPEMVVVPAGMFVMGTPGAPSSHGIAAAESGTTVISFARPFAIGRREVTRAEYASFLADSGHEPQEGCRVWDATLSRFSEDHRRGFKDLATPAAPSDDLPASCVSFQDAQAYVQWLSAKAGTRYRLPSEAEWEYAARAGSRTLRPWGDDPAEGCDFANTYDLVGAARYRLGWPEAPCRDGYADLAPVGQFAANAFGLQDMIGNVREWVQDCATASYIGRPRDGRAWEWIGGCGERVQRGGSWLTPPAESRSGSRAAAPAGEHASDTGFRVAADLGAREREEK
ncbi:MAG TPA: SUMF1/EgtB/PvdO family nonheme iron enzyme [Steroidobacteraceae bacterium]|jgi:formylglycine-generating enzyme required for sulfatase activity|nr:SUMF1/EgtB/PvdO family nonheme iron enzyme [Steroidobacteraceae bacterium]